MFSVALLTAWLQWARAFLSRAGKIIGSITWRFCLMRFSMWPHHCSRVTEPSLPPAKRSWCLTYSSEGRSRLQCLDSSFLQVHEDGHSLEVTKTQPKWSRRWTMAWIWWVHIINGHRHSETKVVPNYLFNFIKQIEHKQPGWIDWRDSCDKFTLIGGYGEGKKIKLPNNPPRDSGSS